MWGHAIRLVDSALAVELEYVGSLCHGRNLIRCWVRDQLINFAEYRLGPRVYSMGQVPLKLFDAAPPLVLPRLSGGFSATFFLQCLIAIGCHTLRLSVD